MALHPAIYIYLYPYIYIYIYISISIGRVRDGPGLEVALHPPRLPRQLHALLAAVRRALVAHRLLPR